MHGQTRMEPTPYGVEIAIMRYMNWSESDLREATAALVEAIFETMQAENHWTGLKQKQDKAKAKRG